MSVHTSWFRNESLFSYTYRYTLLFYYTHLSIIKYWLSSGVSVIKPETIPKWPIGLHRVSLYSEVEDVAAELKEYYKDTVTALVSMTPLQSPTLTKNTRRT